MLTILFIAVLVLAYANGANDNIKPVATLYGSSTLSYRAALWLGTLAQVTGSIASVILAHTLLKAFGGEGVVPDEVVANPGFLLAIATSAAATVLLATRLSFPISTTHALLGGIVGAALVLAPTAPEWGTLGTKFVIPLLVSPVLAVAAAALFYPPLSYVRKRLGIDPVTCLCVGREAKPVTVTTDGTVAVERTGVTLTVDQVDACRDRYVGSIVGIAAQRVVNSLHVLSGFSLGFARGLNDTPKVMALLVAAAWTGIDPRVALGMIAAVMALGGLLHSRRIARTMGERITSMNTGQGMLANTVASTLVIGASLIALPVSTTHVTNGAIFGIGAWTGTADHRVIRNIVLAWIVTLPVAAGIAALVASVV